MNKKQKQKQYLSWKWFSIPIIFDFCIFIDSQCLFVKFHFDIYSKKTSFIYHKKNYSRAHIRNDSINLIISLFSFVIFIFQLPLSWIQNLTLCLCVCVFQIDSSFLIPSYFLEEISQICKSHWILLFRFARLNNHCLDVLLREIQFCLFKTFI